MREKSHKGQRRKGHCSMCGWFKQIGNAKERRSARDRRVLQGTVKKMHA